MASRRPNAVVLVVAAVVLLGVVAVLAGGGGGGDDADVESSGDGALAAAPVVEGETIDGEAITIGGEGPAVVIFLAHWCPHCQREVPFIVDWLEANGEPDGVALLAVTTGIDPGRENYPPDEWLRREHWPIPTLVDDDDSVAAAYGVGAFPYFVAIDAGGRIVARESGELDEAGLEAIIAEARR